MATVDAALRTKVRRLTLAALVALLLLLFVGLPGLLTYRVFFPPRWLVHGATGSALPLEDVQFATEDGMRIQGWLARQQQAKGTIILCHGSGANRVQMMEFAELLFDGGYNALMFDYRGNGNSDGLGTSFGYYEVRDFHAAVAYVKNRPDLPRTGIGALGISMGSGVVLVGAGENPAVEAVVADSVFARLDEVIYRMSDLRLKRPAVRFPTGRIALWLGSLYWRGNLADFRPAASIADIAPRAVMLIHSADDNQNTTLADARELFQAAGEPKELWIAPRGGHVGAAGAFPDEYRRRVLGFFDRYLSR